MKILSLSAYFYPEQISSSHLLSDLHVAYQEASIETEMYVPMPSRGIDNETRKKYAKIKYEEMYGGTLKIHRFAMFKEGGNPILRALRYAFVNIAQYYKGARAEDIDVIYSASTPPTQGVLCGLVKKKLSKRYKKNVPYVFNLQDVFPDSLVTTGLTKKGSLLWKIGRKIENYTYKNADKIIVISESMKRNILEKGVPEEKIVVVSNWIDTEATKPIAKEDNRLFEEFNISRDKFTVLYAGNFGKAQGADVVLQAAELLKDNNDIQFVIFGGGQGFEAAKQTVSEKNLTNVTINALLPQERVPEVYSLGDVALITCKKGVGTSGMPSKTWSIMACNTPIIASFDTDSELAEILAESGAGVTVEPENAEELLEAIMTAKESQQQKAECRSREYVMKHASKDVCVAKYVETIKSVLGKEEEYVTV